MKGYSLSFLPFILLLLFQCTDPEKLRKDKSISNGLALYTQLCVQCHGSDGKGLGTLYPPLASSDFLKENQDSISCIIKRGLDGPLLVNGVDYDQPMPANPLLLDDEISDLINYINNAWGNEGEYKSKDEVTEDLQNCR